MAKEGAVLPQSGGGLIRYFDAGKEAVKLKPEHVVAISVALIVAELAIKFVF